MCQRREPAGGADHLDRLLRRELLVLHIRRTATPDEFIERFLRALHVAALFERPRYVRPADGTSLIRPRDLLDPFPADLQSERVQLLDDPKAALEARPAAVRQARLQPRVAVVQKVP